VESVSDPDEVVSIDNRRADLRVAPTHPIYYCTKSLPRARVTLARDLSERLQYKFLHRWRSSPDRRLTTIDLTDFTDRYQARVNYDCHGSTFRSQLPEGCEPIRGQGHGGYYFDAATFKQFQAELESLGTTVEICSGSNSRGRPYRFDATDFLRFLGWFITEGSVYWSNTRRTASVKIAQKTPRYRQSLRRSFDRLGLSVSRSAEGFSFGSIVFAELFERLCGNESGTKRLPWFTWDLCSAQQRVLLNTLLVGDGNDRGTYYTSSDTLSHDLLRLCLELGIKPQYYRRGEMWRLPTSVVADGFRSDRNVQRTAYEGSFVRLTIEDFPAVLAGRNGNFQWVGVRRVA
jgi:DNA polymerase I